MILRRLSLLVSVVSASILAASCSSDPPSAAPPASYIATAPVYVAIGANETVGDGSTRPLLDSWVQIFYRTALPDDTVFINVAARGATTADAARVQVPQATSLRPTIVTVWLGTQDLLKGVSPANFESALDQVLIGVGDARVTKVLVASIGDLASRVDVVNAAAAQFGTADAARSAIGAYELAIERVAARNGAKVVDVRASEGSAGAAPAGLNLDNAAHARVAAAFAAAAA
ncbi:MAG: SGNH/GDSL hydrolase family protein [Acidimicrobiales bacterium]